MINPEILSDKPTHHKNGVFYKVFTPIKELSFFDFRCAEIMNGANIGKWTVINIHEVDKIENI